MKKIGFLGLGLIGGSIAKAIKHNFNDYQLYANASREATIKEAFAANVTENDSLLPLSAFYNLDYIFLCAPVETNLKYLRELAPHISSHTIITDVGSVKGAICDAVSELGIEESFIGGHPMTGSEKDGFTNSSESLLENAYYVLTRNDKISATAFNEFKAFISSLGAITIETTAEQHDYAVAAISHLPHIISASLVNTVSENDTDDEIMKTIAAGGFKDITRISSSSPVMWQNICIENKDEILKLIDIYVNKLSEIRNTVEKTDENGLFDFFSSAKNYRDSISVKKNGLLPSALDFFVDLSDEAGQIAIIATMLAAKGISIKNIGIVHNREYEEGVLQISFYDEKSLNEAKTILKKHDYTIHSR